MIANLRVKNYKSLKDINIRLKPLNVIIGLNGCGKSNFLDVFSLLSSGAKGELTESINSRSGIGTVLFSGEKEDFDKIVFRIRFLYKKGLKGIEYYLIYKISLKPIGTSFELSTERIDIKRKKGILRNRVTRDQYSCSFIREETPGIFA